MNPNGSSKFLEYLKPTVPGIYYFKYSEPAVLLFWFLFLFPRPPPPQTPKPRGISMNQIPASHWSPQQPYTKLLNELSPLTGDLPWKVLCSPDTWVRSKK
jgi:hypothetical protein